MATINALVQTYVANEKSYPGGSVIIEEGSTGNWIYIVLEGQVKIKKRTPKGTVTMDTLKVGDVFGEMVLLKQQEGRTASVVADGQVRIGTLDTDRIIFDFESLSPQLKSLIRALILRLEETTQKAVALAVDLG
jgi:CRP-like cAMP-binding protein